MMKVPLSILFLSALLFTFCKKENKKVGNTNQSTFVKKIQKERTTYFTYGGLYSIYNVSYIYDSSDRLISFIKNDTTYENPSKTTINSVTTTITYNDIQRISEFNSSNGYVTKFFYDTNEKLEQIISIEGTYIDTTIFIWNGTDCTARKKLDNMYYYTDQIKNGYLVTNQIPYTNTGSYKTVYFYYENFYYSYFYQDLWLNLDLRYISFSKNLPLNAPSKFVRSRVQQYSGTHDYTYQFDADHFPVRVYGKASDNKTTWVTNISYY